MASAKISETNRKVIREFVDHIIASGIFLPRTVKYAHSLVLLAELLKREFKEATEVDLKHLMKGIHSHPTYSAWTKVDYAIVLKRFYKWLLGNDKEYPAHVKWISTTLSKRERRLPGEGDLLTEEDIKKLIATARHPRDKALIAVLAESGCRVGEIMSLPLVAVLKRHRVL